MNRLATMATMKCFQNHWATTVELQPSSRVHSQRLRQGDHICKHIDMVIFNTNPLVHCLSKLPASIITQKVKDGNEITN